MNQSLRTLAPAVLRGRLTPAIPLHRGFAYQGAATHSDSLAFRQRQAERLAQARDAPLRGEGAG